ncbi:MAG: cytochrome b/b6 domain-containing protein [Lysobacterales bacterium]
MADNKKLIWDIPTRLFHWAIVITLGYSWYSMEIANDLEQHFLSGYVALGLIVFRIVWGLVGTRYARFSSFLIRPSEIVAYAKTLASKESRQYAGHNPLGSLSVLALLLFILVQAGTGMFADDEYYFFAPLNQFVSPATAGSITEFHGLSAKIILGLSILHILAIVFYRLIKKEKLVLAMITGKKPDVLDNYEPIAGSRLLRATVLAIIVAAGVYGVVNYV